MYTFVCVLHYNLVTADDQIWRRNCYKSEDGFFGCKTDNLGNGTHEWDIEICVCHGSLCNEKMGDLPSTSTKMTTMTTTHTGKN